MDYIDYKTFASRMKKNDIRVFKLDTTYAMADTRCWTALINEGTDNILVTFNVNRYAIGNQYFDIMSSKKIITDVYVDDIYDTIDLLINNQIPTIYFTDENE